MKVLFEISKLFRLTCFALGLSLPAQAEEKIWMHVGSYHYWISVIQPDTGWVTAKWMDFDRLENGKLLFPAKGQPFGMMFEEGQDPHVIRQRDPKTWKFLKDGLSGAKKANLSMYSQISPEEGLFIEPLNLGTDPTKWNYIAAVADEDHKKSDNKWTYVQVDEKGNDPIRVFEPVNPTKFEEDLTVAIMVKKLEDEWFRSLPDPNIPETTSAHEVTVNNPNRRKKNRALLKKGWIVKRDGHFEYNWDKILQEEFVLFDLPNIKADEFLRTMMRFMAAQELLELSLDEDEIQEELHLKIEDDVGANGEKVAKEVRKERERLRKLYVPAGQLSPYEKVFFETYKPLMKEILQAMRYFSKNHAELDRFINNRRLKITVDGKRSYLPLGSAPKSRKSGHRGATP